MKMRSHILIFSQLVSKDKDDPTLKKVIELYHSKEVTDAIKKETNDGSISVDLSLNELEKIVK